MVPSCGLSEFISNAVSGASTPETSLTEYIKQSSSISYPPSPTPAASGAKGTLLLIGNDLSPRDCVALSKVAKALALPLVLVRTYGFIGTCRVQSATDEVSDDEAMRRGPVKVATCGLTFDIVAFAPR